MTFGGHMPPPADRLPHVTDPLQGKGRDRGKWRWQAVDTVKGTLRAVSRCDPPGDGGQLGTGEHVSPVVLGRAPAARPRRDFTVAEGTAVPDRGWPCHRRRHLR